MTALKCLRCNHEWFPQIPNTLPKVCPKCKSYDWQKPFLRPPKDKKPLA